MPKGIGYKGGTRTRKVKKTVKVPRTRATARRAGSTKARRAPGRR